MSVDEFVGASRIALVDGLVRIFEKDVRDSQKSRWVSLEAPSGWGKTRVGRELYTRLAVEQREPRYWPASIDVSDRKTVEPTVVDIPPNSSPGYLWWGISCSIRNDQAVSSLLLKADLDRLYKHETYAERTVKKNENWFMRLINWIRDDTSKGAWDASVRKFFQLGYAISGFLLSNLAYLLLRNFSLALTGLSGVVLILLLDFTFISLWPWGRKRHIARRKYKQHSQVNHGDDGAEDIVDEAVRRLGRMTKRGVPLVIFVEDVHSAGELVLQLLDRLLFSDGALLLITTGLSERIEKKISVRDLMKDHVGRLSRVNRISHPGEGFPEGAGLTDLELDARRSILYRSWPKVEVKTERALLARYVNPYTLKLFCEYCNNRVDEYLNSEGYLEIPEREINDLPGSIYSFYEILWKELPKEVQISLAVACLITPASIDVGAGGGEQVWMASILSSVLKELNFKSNQNIQRAGLRRALESESHSWVWNVNKKAAAKEVLQAFVETPQKDIAYDQGGNLLNRTLEYESNDAHNEILSRLERTLLSKKSVKGLKLFQNRYIARCILALYTTGDYITNEPTVVALAIETILSELANLPRELSERTQLYDIFENLDSSDIPRNIDFNIRNLGGIAYGESGQISRAIDIHSYLLNDLRTDLDDNHPNILITRHNLATRFADIGRFEEAIEQLEDVLVQRKKVLSADHPDTLTTGNNLASCLRSAGRFDDAILQFEDVLVQRKKVLSADHPDTLTTGNNLASCLADTDRFEEAIERFEEVLVRQTSVLGADHPSTFLTRNNFATCLKETGRFKDAIEQFEEVLVQQTSVLGADHPNTFITRSNFATCLGESGRLEAIEQFEKLLEDCKRVLSTNNPGTLAIWFDFALCLVEFSRFEEAIEQFENLLVHQESVFGADHPKTGDTWLALVALKIHLGKSQ